MHHRTASLAFCALVAAFFATVPAVAQDAGNALRGEELAARICADCHGVNKGDASRNWSAPPFEKVAASEGMSATALNVALISSHRDMPNLILQPAERANVIAYIMSLKD